MNGIYLLMGSNMGNRLAYLREATRLLSTYGIQVLDESSIYETAPWGPKDQSWFLNIVVEVVTSKDPSTLLSCILEVERTLGRVRKEKWGERCIDIDILYYHDEIITRETLSIPHPGIPDRKFTLVPLVEMAPLELHPSLQKNQMELLAACTDSLDCKLTEFKL